jgi:murein DD-endopeptidase MepM/ murein hydrolase activator NlpD
MQAQREVTALVAQREQALQVAEQERAANEARMRELQAESDKIAAEIRAMAAGGGQTVRDGARLPMPVKGWKSSDFGMRYDPFYNVWQLHAGADFAAPAGSPIWAAASGNVFRAGWNGGYGNYTCVYHGTYQGKGFATCYAHQSAILVRAGQMVRQGQVIGRVGTTGASTGNHLHFEVRLDGAPVDPVPWLPGCLC